MGYERINRMSRSEVGPVFQRLKGVAEDFSGTLNPGQTVKIRVNYGRIHGPRMC